MSAIRVPHRIAPPGRAQRGLSLIGLLIVGGLLVAVALVVMKVLPSVLEYNAIRGAVTKVATGGGDTVRDYQLAFDRYAAIDDITSIAGKDLVIDRRPDGQAKVSFQYEKRIELFGPVSLVIDYRGSSR